MPPRNILAHIPRAEVEEWLRNYRAKKSAERYIGADDITQDTVKDVSQSLVRQIATGMGSRLSKLLGPAEGLVAPIAKKAARAGAQAGIDISEGFQEGPTALLETVKALPEQVVDVGRTAVEDPLRIARAALGGVAESGMRIANTPANVADFLSRAEVLEPQGDKLRVFPESSEKVQEFIGKDTRPSDELIKSLTGFLPFMPLSKAGKIAPVAAYGATSEEGPLKGAATALTAAAIPEIGIKGATLLKNFSPPKILKTDASPAKLEEALEVTKGTSTGLGDVLESPGLKRIHENIISRLPGSGAEATSARAAETVKKRGQIILDELAGIEERPPDLQLAIGKELEKAQNFHKERKKSFYNKVDSLHESERVPLDLSSFQSAAKRYEKILEENSLLRFNPNQNDLFNKVAYLSRETAKRQKPPSAAKSAILDAEGAPFESVASAPDIPVSLAEANTLASLLRETADKTGASLDTTQRQMSSMYGKLASSLKKDIQNSIEKGNSPAVKDAYAAAEKNYARNYSPFLDKEIFKYTLGGKSSEKLVSDLIGSGKVDQFQRIKKVVDLLPPEAKNYLGSAYLERAINKEGNLDPRILRRQIDNLGRRQFEALFPEKTVRRSLLNYSKLSAKNERALNRMFNPQTGQTLLDWFPYAVGAAGSAVGHMVGGFPASALLSVGVPGALAAGGNALNKMLTSERVRNKIVGKMIKNAIDDPRKIEFDKKLTDNFSRLLSAATQPQLEDSTNGS